MKMSRVNKDYIQKMMSQGYTFDKIIDQLERSENEYVDIVLNTENQECHMYGEPSEIVGCLIGMIYNVVDNLPIDNHDKLMLLEKVSKSMVTKATEVMEDSIHD